MTASGSGALAGGRVGRFFAEAIAITDAPLPRARMLRTGLTMAAVFGFWAVLGRLDEAVLAAVFTNLLLFLDHPGPLRERLLVLVTAALVQAAGGALGFLLAGHGTLIVIAALLLAILAGLVHNAVPGVESIPRNALITFVVAAYFPPEIVRAGAIGAASGVALAVCGIVIDWAIRREARGPDLAALAEAAVWPSRLYGIVYGVAAIFGMLLGYAVGTERPYWITITVLLVMQPDRRAGLRRSLQRFVGTVAGVGAGFAIAAAAPEAHRLGFLLPLVFILPFFWPLGFARNFSIGVAIISVWILILLALALPRAMTFELFAARLLDTAIGCALALVATLVLGLLRPGTDKDQAR